MGASKLAPEVVEHQVRRFGFVWNEVVESWREEDIVENAERLKLQFNELPAIQFADLMHIWSGEAHVDWEASELRLPVWVYSDILPACIRWDGSQQGRGSGRQRGAPARWHMCVCVCGQGV